MPNPDTSIIAKFCLNDCQDQTYDLYKYRIIDGDNKKCYTKCPSEAKYHFDFDLGIDNFCYEKCPGEKQAPYHKKVVLFAKNYLNLMEDLFYMISKNGQMT